MIEIRIVEGVLDEIAIAGLSTLCPVFVEDRIRLGAGTPLDVDDLRERIQLLLDDPAIERINARLGPGRDLGESRLELDVVETPPYRTDVRISTIAHLRSAPSSPSPSAIFSAGAIRCASRSRRVRG